MLEFIVQAIKVLLPCIVAGAVVRYINVQNEKKQQELSEKNLEACTVEKYEIAYPMVLNVIVCVGFAIVVVCAIDYSMEEKQNWGMWVIAGGLFGLYTYGFLGSCIWKIWVNGEQIIYRGYNGIKHYYTFSDITRITEKTNGAYIYYAGNKRLFKIDNNLFEGAKLTGQLVRSGVPCDLEGMSTRRFTLKPQTVNWVVAAMCAGGFAYILGILVKQNETGSVYFVPMFIGFVVSVVLLIDLLSDRFLVANDEVERRRGIVTKRFRVDEIEYVRLKKGLFRENLEIYVNGKCITKVWTKNRSYDLLRRRLAKEKIGYKR